MYSATLVVSPLFSRSESISSAQVFKSFCIFGISDTRITNLVSILNGDVFVLRDGVLYIVGLSHNNLKKGLI